MSGTRSGDFPRMPTKAQRFLAGRRILEVFWLGYRLPRLDETAQRQLIQETVTLLRESILPRRDWHSRHASRSTGQAGEDPYEPKKK